MNYAFRLITVILACFFLIACGQRAVKGSGHTTTQNYEIAPFNNIKLTGAITVIAIVSNAAQSLSVNADDNLQSYVTNSVKDGTLTIGVKPGYQLAPTQPVSVQVNINRLDSLVVQDAVLVNVNGIQDNLEVNAGGTSQLLLTGKAPKVSMTLKDNANLDARNLIVDDLQLDVSNNAQAQVYADKTLNAKISGGNTVYFGNATVVNRTLTGGEFQKGETASAYGGQATPPAPSAMPEAVAPAQPGAPGTSPGNPGNPGNPNAPSMPGNNPAPGNPASPTPPTPSMPTTPPTPSAPPTSSAESPVQ